MAATPTASTTATETAEAAGNADASAGCRSAGSIAAMRRSISGSDSVASAPAAPRPPSAGPLKENVRNDVIPDEPRASTRSAERPGASFEPTQHAGQVAAGMHDRKDFDHFMIVMTSVPDLVREHAERCAAGIVAKLTECVWMLLNTIDHAANSSTNRSTCSGAFAKYQS
jgi:hypothetical protein